MTVRTERGISLVEVMVAVAISLLVLLAITAAYLTTSRTQGAQSDTTRLNESGRSAFDLITREIRKAGFRNTWSLSGTATNFCSGRPVGSLLDGANDLSTLTISGTLFSISNASDMLRVRYFGEDATVTGPVFDCQGYPVAAPSTPGAEPVEDALFVAPDPNNGNEPTLFCHTTNPAPVVSTAYQKHPGELALVAGVESLQFVYGEDTDADGIVNRYVPWGLVSNPDNVLSIKASLVVRSPNPVVGYSGTRTIRHFGPDYPAATNGDSGAVFTTPSDSRLRLPSALSTEIALRNFRRCD